MTASRGIRDREKELQLEKQRAYYKAWRLRNPERAAEISENSFRNFYGSFKGRITHMLNNARGRARKLGVPFDLTRAFLEERLRRGVCEVTGLPFDWSIGHKKTHRTNPFSPSLDRIIVGGSYTQDNVRVVVWVYNRSRGAFCDDAFDTFVLAYADKLRESGRNPQGALPDFSDFPLADEQFESFEFDPMI